MDRRQSLPSDRPQLRLTGTTARTGLLVRGLPIAGDAVGSGEGGRLDRRLYDRLARPTSQPDRRAAPGLPSPARRREHPPRSTARPALVEDHVGPSRHPQQAPSAHPRSSPSAARLRRGSTRPTTGEMSPDQPPQLSVSDRLPNQTSAAAQARRAAPEGAARPQIPRSIRRARRRPPTSRSAGPRPPRGRGAACRSCWSGRPGARRPTSGAASARGRRRRPGCPSDAARSC